MGNCDMFVGLGISGARRAVSRVELSGFVEGSRGGGGGGGGGGGYGGGGGGGGGVGG